MKKVLIIEDDLNLVELYKENLTIEGIEVFTATTGKTALALMVKDIPDLIILDIMIPGDMSGFDVLEEIKRNQLLSSIPILMLTNLDSQEKVAKEIGVTEYIVKANTSLAEVISKVKKYLA